MQDIGDWIRKRRQERGWKQRDLARVVRVSDSAVSLWENRHSRPSPANLIDICAAFGVSVQAFFGPDGPYHGHMIENPEEAALLVDWRKLDHNSQELIRKMIKGIIDRPPNAGHSSKGHG
jgi:transcriptional regulator with XRE-family HTH domain